MREMEKNFNLSDSLYFLSFVKYNHFRTKLPNEIKTYSSYIKATKYELALTGNQFS